MALNDDPSAGKTRPLFDKGKLATRFRNINILLFIAAFCIMLTVMLVVFNNVAWKISSDHAGRYAVSSAEALSAHVVKEISLISKAAHSNAIIEWIADEGNERKKSLAYEEMSEIVGELYSYNLYVGMKKSLNEYRIEINRTSDDIRPFDVLEANNPTDAWFFKCLGAENDYNLNVDIDHEMERKRLWIDYKVIKDNVVLGVVATGLEFSHIVGELFSHYENNNIRGIIMDENGMIFMDSTRMSDKDFLYGNFQTRFDEEFSDPKLLTVIQSYHRGHYSGTTSDPTVMELSSGQYRYMTIMPIKYTNWSVMILSGTAPQYGMSLFVPALAAVLILLLSFSLAVSSANYRLIFMPLKKLEGSLNTLKEEHGENIYGIERDDELGELAKTIQDLFTQANIDGLTGISNRRFMEENLRRIMKYLSRSTGLLSIIMLDVDYFKKYNDTYGHDQGDTCLKSVAQSLAGVIKRADDFAARYGGEEFVVVLPNTDEVGARGVAEELLESVTALNIPHANNAVAPCVTVSIGVTTGKVKRNQIWEDYVKRADEALYMSKQNGRNRYTFLDFPSRESGTV